MSALDLIRTLRRALAELRDAHDPSAVNQLARALADELEKQLGQPSPMDDELGASILDVEHARDMGMAVRA